MVGRAVQLTLREMQAHFTDGRVLAGMAVVALLLGLTGPFGTFEQLELGARLAYWAAIVIATYGLGFVAARLATNLFGLALRQPWARVLVYGVLTGIPVTLAVIAINLVAYGNTGIEPLQLWLQCTLIGMGVMAISEILDGPAARPAESPPAPAAPEALPHPPILDRVPLPARGALWALVVQDHYVDVVTARGTTLVLMRLSDAIREVGETRGVQIHRSHWVALDAVARVIKADGKVAVELPDGRRLGISRGYMDAARAAGLLV